MIKFLHQNPIIIIGEMYIDLDLGERSKMRLLKLVIVDDCKW